MDDDDKIEVYVSLTPAQALAFAQFLKRAGHSNYQECAVDSNEAYQMLYAGEELRKSLAEAGYAPR